MKKAFVFTLIMCASGYAVADEVKIDDVAATACHSVKEDKERLACFDKAVTQETDVGNGKGKWVVTEKQSPVDDSVNVMLRLSSESPIRNNFGQSFTPLMTIDCSEKKTSLYIDWNSFLGSNEKDMLYRIDKQKAVTKAWNMSTDSKAVFYQGSPVKFIKSLMAGKSIYTQITPYQDSPVNATFDITGLESAIAPLRKACGW